MPLPTPTLQTERLRLRPFSEADADDIFALPKWSVDMLPDREGRGTDGA